MDIPPNLARTCKGCKADVAAVKVPGKRVGETAWTILDFVATDQGTYFIELDPTSDRPALRGGPIKARGQREGMRAQGVGLHTNHYKTCPKAEDFRRRRKPLL